MQKKSLGYRHIDDPEKSRYFYDISSEGVRQIIHMILNKSPLRLPMKYRGQLL